MKIRSWFILGLAALGLLAVSACGPSGLSNEEAEALRDELSTVEERLDEIETEVAALESGDADAEEVASNARNAAQDAKDTVSSVRSEMEPPPEPEADPASVDPAGGGGGDMGQPATP